MKIKAKNPKVASMKLCVPVDGIIDIDSNGLTDVSPKCAAHLVTGTNDWEYLKKKVESEEESEEDENGDGEISEKEEFDAGLKGMSITEMKDMAKEAGYPEEEWTGLTNKKVMSAYLSKKFDEVNSESEEDEEDDSEEEK